MKMEAETSQTLAPGALVAERYRVVSFLDEGGMGAVYRVEHLHMRKAFALKVLHRALIDRPEILARFEREAIAAGSIQHPNVAAATDFGRLADGSFFLVMEFVRGRNLRDELQAGALAPERATRIMRGIVAGVGAAHAKGIVHRDLKPENVMLVEHDGDRDFVKVLDFGIAKLQDPSAPGAGGAPLTRMGSLLGTPEYMSPEQALGNTVDSRADLYSIGVIFYELLSGRCPFEGDAVRVIQQHVAAEAPPLPESVAAQVDPRIVGIVRKLLEKRPEDRFATAAELSDALAEVAAQPRVVLRPTAPAASFATRGRLREFGERLRKVPVVVRLGVFALAVAGPALVLALSRGGNEREQVDPVERGQAIDPHRVAIATPSQSAPSPAPSAVPLPPAPTPSEGNAPIPERRAAATSTGSAAPTHRKTGPGGIYIPPPKDWFK